MVERNEEFENRAGAPSPAPETRVSSVQPGVSVNPPEAFSPENDKNHRFNFGLIGLYQVIMRTGWIFKTESIVMPVVLDLIGGSGWLRGCLPMLNRFGQSIPPLMASDYVRSRAVKKWLLSGCTAMMGICFLLLAAVWAITGGQPSWWLPGIFLLIYAVFFCSTGINQLVLNTLIGKLVRVRRRGMLIQLGTTIGVVSAVICAWFLLRTWLGEGRQSFVKIFMFTGVAFVIAGAFAVGLKERRDEPGKPIRNGLEILKMSFRAIRSDRNFMLLAIIASLFGMSMTLFPHYQALARVRLHVDLADLLPWLIAQNLGAAFFSIPSGWVGDRFGYRRVLRWIMFAICISPVLALLLSRMGDFGSGWFFIVFCMVGLTPVAMRSFNNYTLEIAKPELHPRYLSTLALCMAIPAILSSSLLGALVDWVSFEFVFGLVVALLAVGWMLTFWLEEPRHTDDDSRPQSPH